MTPKHDDLLTFTNLDRNHRMPMLANQELHIRGKCEPSETATIENQEMSGLDERFLCAL